MSQCGQVVKCFYTGPSLPCCLSWFGLPLQKHPILRVKQHNISYSSGGCRLEKVSVGSGSRGAPSFWIVDAVLWLVLKGEVRERQQENSLCFFLQGH